MTVKFHSESVVRKTLGPQPQTTQDITKDTHPISGQRLKSLIPPRIEPRTLGWKAGTLPTTPWRRIIIKGHSKSPPVFNCLVNFSLSGCQIVLYRFCFPKHSDCCLSLNFLHFFILCLAMGRFTIAQRVLIVKTFYHNG